MAANDKIEQLECEDNEERLNRIRCYAPHSDRAENLADSLLATLDSTSTHRGTSRTPLDALLAQPPTDINRAQTAQLLQRVQAFLPQLQASNQNVEALARENPASVDIETFNGTEESYIQLSLGLGLFEQRNGHSADNDINSSSSSSDSDTSSEEDGDSSSDDEDSSDEDEDPQPDLISLVTGTRPIIPLPSRQSQRITEGHPGILVLGSSDEVLDSDHET